MTKKQKKVPYIPGTIRRIPLIESVSELGMRMPENPYGDFSKEILTRLDSAKDRIQVIADSYDRTSDTKFAKIEEIKSILTELKAFLNEQNLSEETELIPRHMTMNCFKDFYSMMDAMEFLEDIL